MLDKVPFMVYNIINLTLQRIAGCVAWEAQSVGSVDNFYPVK